MWVRQIGSYPQVLMILVNIGMPPIVILKELHLIVFLEQTPKNVLEPLLVTIRGMMTESGPVSQMITIK